MTFTILLICIRSLTHHTFLNELQVCLTQAKILYFLISLLTWYNQLTKSCIINSSIISLDSEIGKNRVW
ncbi:hypothetical protein PAHAL_1G122800 [Panicum hallii]|uniref:Uncharacterized protein n=1 Tax=Panicum hallii TaxID=206008 RepID=A0A2S3GNR1_9POAL|nr:hypothetical protein PAHAL_1G122800 [Panicum hallii]